MEFINKKRKLCVVSVALGVSVMITSFTLTGTTAVRQEDKQAVSEKIDSKELSSASITKVDAQLLSAAEEESTEENKSAFANKFMVNVSEFLNVRASADPNSEIVGKLYPGSGGDVLEKGTEWTKISSGNLTGYVNNQYVVFDKDAETLANQVCPWIATVNTDTLKVRKEPNQNSGVWGLIAGGETYTVTQFMDGWVAIDYNGNTGYISIDYVVVVQKIGTGITIAEEQAAIQAEQAKQAAAEEAKKKAEQDKQTKIQKAMAASKVSQTVQTSAYNVSEYDAYLLACLVDAEAGYDCYEGRLAVANIVLNRLNRYGSISNVIYAKNQFSVVSMGILDKKLAQGPSAGAVAAARDALSGKNNVPQYTSFCSVKVANYGSYKAYSVIGGQVFYCK